jgi:hypothetical protein
VGSGFLAEVEGIVLPGVSLEKAFKTNRESPDSAARLPMEIEFLVETLN